MMNFIIVIYIVTLFDQELLWLQETLAFQQIVTLDHHATYEENRTSLKISRL